MKKALGAVLLVAAAAIGMQVKQHGLDGAFGGRLAWMAPTTREQAQEILHETSFYAHEDPAEPGARKVPVTDAVRSRVANSMNQIQDRQRRSDR